MIDALLRFLMRRKSWRLIKRDGDPYLSRFYLFRTARVSVMIHELHSSDAPDPHDHPWNNFTLVLRHGYREHYHDGTYKWLGPGSMRYRSARELHWLEKTTDEPPMTLFIRFKRLDRKWGFIPRDVPFKSVEEQPGLKLRGRFFPHF
jgi:hypothetical protein